jgi:hypothetical protein
LLIILFFYRWFHNSLISILFDFAIQVIKLELRLREC